VDQCGWDSGIAEAGEPSGGGVDEHGWQDASRFGQDRSGSIMAGNGATGHGPKATAYPNFIHFVVQRPYASDASDTP
jgi:hypothetical protein